MAVQKNDSRRMGEMPEGKLLISMAVPTFHTIAPAAARAGQRRVLYCV